MGRPPLCTAAVPVVTSNGAEIDVGRDQFGGAVWRSAYTCVSMPSATVILDPGA
jgi:hypothetical protein